MPLRALLFLAIGAGLGSAVTLLLSAPQEPSPTEVFLAPMPHANGLELASEILPPRVHTVCNFGPYSSLEFLTDPRFQRPEAPTVQHVDIEAYFPVDEGGALLIYASSDGRVLFADALLTFNSRDRMIWSDELPTGSDLVNLSGCELARDVTFWKRNTVRGTEITILTTERG